MQQGRTAYRQADDSATPSDIPHPASPIMLGAWYSMDVQHAGQQVQDQDDPNSADDGCNGRRGCADADEAAWEEQVATWWYAAQAPTDHPAPFPSSSSQPKAMAVAETAEAAREEQMATWWYAAQAPTDHPAPFPSSSQPKAMAMAETAEAIGVGASEAHAAEDAEPTAGNAVERAKGHGRPTKRARLDGAECAPRHAAWQYEAAERAAQETARAAATAGAPACASGRPTGVGTGSRTDCVATASTPASSSSYCSSSSPSKSAASPTTQASTREVARMDAPDASLRNQLARMYLAVAHCVQVCFQQQHDMLCAKLYDMQQAVVEAMAPIRNMQMRPCAQAASGSTTEGTPQPRGPSASVREHDETLLRKELADARASAHGAEQRELALRAQIELCTARMKRRADKWKSELAHGRTRAERAERNEVQLRAQVGALRDRADALETRLLAEWARLRTTLEKDSTPDEHAHGAAHDDSIAVAVGGLRDATACMERAAQDVVRGANALRQHTHTGIEQLGRLNALTALVRDEATERWAQAEPVMRAMGRMCAQHGAPGFPSLPAGCAHTTPPRAHWHERVAESGRARHPTPPLRRRRLSRAYSTSSDVWRYFTICHGGADDNARTAAGVLKCTMCTMTYSRNTSTTTLRSHMRRCHAEIYRGNDHKTGPRDIKQAAPSPQSPEDGRTCARTQRDQEDGESADGAQPCGALCPVAVVAPSCNHSHRQRVQKDHDEADHKHGHDGGRTDASGKEGGRTGEELLLDADTHSSSENDLLLIDDEDEYAGP